MFNLFRKPVPGPRRKPSMAEPLKIWESNHGTKLSPFLVEPVDSKKMRDDIKWWREKLPGLPTLPNLVSSKNEIEWFFFDAYIELTIMLEYFGWHTIYGSKYFWDNDWVWRAREIMQVDGKVITKLTVHMIKLREEWDYYFDHSAIFALDETSWLLNLSHAISQDMTNSYSNRPLG